MYALRRTIVAFLLGALIFGAPVAIGAQPHVHTLAQVLAAGNDAEGQAVVNLADPSDPQDAATKSYVDASHPQPHLFVQTAEPDAEPGDVWIDPTPGPQPFAKRIRNESDDGWLIGDVAAIDQYTYSGWQRLDDGTVMLFVGAVEMGILPSGHVYIKGTPTGDPGVENAIYEDESGALHRSFGP
jgi:hypothetical protein